MKMAVVCLSLFMSVDLPVATAWVVLVGRSMRCVWSLMRDGVSILVP